MPIRWELFVLMSSSVASAIIAVAVYTRAPDRVWNRLFAIQAFGVSIWVLLNYLLQIANTESEADLWLRLTHPVVALVICSHVDLFWVFPERVELAPWPRRVILYGIGALFGLVAISSNLYRSLRLAEGTVLVDYGWPFGAFGLFTTCTVGYADLILIRKRSRLTGLQRVQVNYVLTGMILCQIIAVLTMVLLPVVWKNCYYCRWGSASYMFVIGFMAYAIDKAGIIRPAAAITRTGAYILTGLIVIVLFTVLQVSATPILERNGLSLQYVYLVTGLALGLIGATLHQYIRQRLERSLPSAHLPEAARQASDAILRTLDNDELPDFLSGTIQQMLGALHVTVFVREGTSGPFWARSRKLALAEPAPQLQSALPETSLLLQLVSRSRDLLDRSQIRRFHSLREAQLVLAEMREFDVEVVAPILWENHLLGLIMVGERVSGDMYAPEELQLLRTLLPQVSLAMQNAQLFDEVVRIKEYNENILRQMQSGVIAVNAERQVVTLNPAAEEMLGLSAETTIGQPLDVLPAKIAGRLAQALHGLLTRPEDRLEVINSRGERLPVTCSTSHWVGSALSQEGAIAVISDLTLVEELERERRDAEHLNLIRLLSAGMAHELRNPLVAIRTFSELLPTRWDDDEFRMSFQATAHDEIDRIDRLLTDLLMLSKPADAVVEPTDVDLVCEGVLRALSASAEAAEVELLADLQLGNSFSFLGDRSRLHQALVNLIKNAIEAEPRGGTVTVSTRTVSPYSGGTFVRITVHNPNSYIPADQQQQIFRPFFTRRHGGTGLGLPVCHTIIEEHSGTIRVDSEPELGTSFIVQLPVNAVSGENSYGRSAGH